MAFDLEYVFVPCEHRYVDDIVQTAISIGKILLDSAPICNETFLNDGYLGNDYLINNPELYEAGKIEIAPDRSLIGIFPLKYRFAHSPRLFVKTPGEYLRKEIPGMTYTSLVDKVRYGAGHRYNEKYEAYDYYIRYASSFFLISDTANPQWEIEPVYNEKNEYLYHQVKIYRYDPRFTYIMDYNVEPSECPHCFNNNMKNDLIFDTTGKLRIVLNTKKLSQQVTKAILTPKGKNWYFPEYGTTIKELLGAKNMFLGYIIRHEIFTQLQRIKQIHDVGIMTSPGFYTPFETLKDIIGTELYPKESRSLDLKVILLTNSLEKVDTQIIKVA